MLLGLVEALRKMELTRHPADRVDDRRSIKGTLRRMVCRGPPGNSSVFGAQIAQNMSGALFTNCHSPNLFSYSSTQMQASSQENDEPELCLTFLQKPRQNDVFGEYSSHYYE